MSSQAGRPTVSVEIDHGVVDMTTPETTPAAQAKAAKASAQKRDKKAERQAQLESKLASGSYIPEMGFPAFLYSLNKLFGHPEQLPRPTKKEVLRRQQDLAAQTIMDRRLFVHGHINDITNSWKGVVDGKEMRWTAFGCVIMFANEKGGSGKSTMSALTGDYLAREHDASVLILPAADNDGSTALKAGAEDSSTLTIPQLEQLLRELTQNGTVKADPRAVQGMLRKNDAGAYVVAQTALPNSFGGQRLRWMMEQLKPMFQFIILDTGNAIARFGNKHAGLPRGGNVTYEAAMQADVIVFTCNPDVSDSPFMMTKTMDACTHIRQPEKLSRSIVAVVGHKNGEHDVVKWVTYAENKTTMHGQPLAPRDFPFRVAKRPEGDRPSGALILVPYEEELKNNPRPVMARLRQATQDVVQEMVYQIILRAGAHQGRDFTVLDQIKQAEADALKYDAFGGLSHREIAANIADSGIVSELSIHAR